MKVNSELCDLPRDISHIYQLLLALSNEESVETGIVMWWLPIN